MIPHSDLPNISMDELPLDELPPEIAEMMAQAEPRLGLREKVRLILGMAQMAWGASPRLFSASVFLTILQAVIPVGSAWVIKVIFDQVAASYTSNTPINSRLIVSLIMIQGFLLLAGKVLPTVEQYFSKELGRFLKIDIHQSLYRKINQFAGIRFFESPEFHDLFRLSRQGAETGPASIVQTLTGVIRGVTLVLSFIVVVASLSWWMVGLLLLTMVPQVLILMKIGVQRFQLAFELSPDQRKSFYYGHVMGSAETAKEIRLFNIGDYLLTKLLRSLNNIQTAERAQDQRELGLTGGLEFLSSSVSAVTYGIIIWQALLRLITLGDVTLYTSAIQNVQGGIQQVVFGMAQLNENALFFTNFERLMALPQPIAITPDPQPITPLQSGIELQDVWFRYEDHLPWILKGVNLTIPAGSCLALVGLNGAGKSTIVKLLTRMYDPTKGKILWDGTDIQAFSPDGYRQMLGTVFQDFVQYEMSVRDNISLGNVEKSDDLDAIKRAATKAGVSDFINQLPEQYDTILSRWLVDSSTEAGVDLSGGQWQRIAIARTFMRDSDLLILDEPTAALDAEAEYDMYERFTTLIEGATSLLISHRFSTVRMADQIAVLSDGEIVEYGAHSDLMQFDGLYRQLYSMQAERYEPMTA